MKVPKRKIAKVAKIFLLHGATEVYIFGSAASGQMHRDSDVDFAVRGLPARNFYHAVGKALEAMERSIDVVDLGDNTPIARFLSEKGNLIRVG